MIIRPEHPDDNAAVLRLTYKAFLTLDYPGRRRMDEHYLIHLLQGSPFVIPELTFVAELDGEIIGHILFTNSKVLRPNGEAIDTITFGPLSVLPERHRQGIGAALVRHSLEKAREFELRRSFNNRCTGLLSAAWISPCAGIWPDAAGRYSGRFLHGV